MVRSPVINLTSINEDLTGDDGVVKYINRLSDFLFVLGRKAASDAGFEETR